MKNEYREIESLGDENSTGHREGKLSKKPLKKITTGRFAIYNKKVTYSKGYDGRLKVITADASPSS